jgi:hypothetical protein
MLASWVQDFVAPHFYAVHCVQLVGETSVNSISETSGTVSIKTGFTTKATKFGVQNMLMNSLELRALYKKLGQNLGAHQGDTIYTKPKCEHALPSPPPSTRPTPPPRRHLPPTLLSLQSFRKNAGRVSIITRHAGVFCMSSKKLVVSYSYLLHLV